MKKIFLSLYLLLTSFVLFADDYCTIPNANGVVAVVSVQSTKVKQEGANYVYDVTFTVESSADKKTIVQCSISYKGTKIWDGWVTVPPEKSSSVIKTVKIPVNEDGKGAFKVDVYSGDCAK